MLKYKTQSIISILGLTIGFTAFILFGYWHYWEHNFDTFHPKWETTYAITTSGLLETRGAKYADLNQLHEEAKNYIVKLPEIEKHCLTSEVLYSSKEKERIWLGMRVDSAFFEMFACDLIEGTHYKSKYDNNSVILTQSTAEFLFGKENCVGKQFEVSENRSLTIAGVMKNYPANSNFKFDYLLLGHSEYDRFNKRMATYIRIKENIDVENLREKISNYKIELEDNKIYKYSEWKHNLCSLPNIHLTCSPNLDTRFRNINILAMGGFLILISAFMNLLVLFISSQHIKLRYNLLYLTIGSSIKGLLVKNIIELTIYLIIAFILSISLIEIIFPIYSNYTRLDNEGFFNNFVQYISKDKLLNTSIASYLIITLIFLALSSIPVYLLIKKKRSTKILSIRNILIAGQVFIGSLFLITGLAFYLQFQYTHAKDKGLETENIWQIDLGFNAVHEKDATQYTELLRSSPYIDDVTTLTSPIFSTSRQYYCSYITSLPMHGLDDDDVNANVFVVEPNFISFFRMKMKSGDWLSTNGIPEYVINETGADMMKLIENFSTIYDIPNSNDNQFRISGVLKDYHYFPMQYPLEKTFFHIASEKEKANLLLKNPYIYIKVLPENKENALTFAKQHYTHFSKDEVSPEKQFQYLPDIMKELNAANNHMSNIFLTLAIICILISSFGIYFLVALVTEQRRKEIATRIMHGAKFNDILKLFLNKYLFITIIANIFSLSLGFLFIQKWLQTYTYHFNPSFLMFFAVLSVTIFIVVISVAVQVKQVLKMNPTEVVKSE